MAPMYTEERDALYAAVHTALEEDGKGDVPMETIKRINQAVANFRAKFRKNSPTFGLDYSDSMTFFTTVASLSRLLNDPSMKQFLEKLESNDQRTVGDLIAFMDAFNLRFGRATTERQVEVYTRLVPIFTAIRDSMSSPNFTASAPDRTGDSLKEAAQAAFKPMTWESLEAHARGQ